MGSGDWWNEVEHHRLGRPRGRGSARSPRPRRPAAPVAAGQRSTGAGHTTTRRTPGSIRAASAPAGPHSTVTSAAAATARTAGPASSTSPALSRRTTSTRRVTTASPATPGRAATRSDRTTGASATSSRAGHRGRHQHPVRPRRPRGLDVRPDVPDHRAPDRGATPRAAAAASTMPGAVSGTGTRRRARAGRPARRRTDRAARPPGRPPREPAPAVISPRAIPDWLVTTPMGTPARAQQSERGPGRRHRTHQIRVRRSTARPRPACRHGRRAPRRGGRPSRPRSFPITPGQTRDRELLLSAVRYYIE